MSTTNTYRLLPPLCLTCDLPSPLALTAGRRSTPQPATSTTFWPPGAGGATNDPPSACTALPLAGEAVLLAYASAVELTAALLRYMAPPAKPAAFDKKVLFVDTALPPCMYTAPPFCV